jgi:hypothetical protein
MITLHGIEVKVRDKVWELRHGWSEVTELCGILTEYKIETNFSSYTIDGKYNKDDKFPSLFWNEFGTPKEAFIKPEPKMAVDTKVLVWNDDDNKTERHYFSHFNSDDKICCFNNGVTSWSTTSAATTSWNNWKLYKEN